MATLSNLPAKGAVKQGGLIGVIDFTEAGGAISRWSLKLNKIGDKYFLFGLHSSDSSNVYKPLGKLGADTWSDANLGNLKSIVREAARPDLEYTTYGVTTLAVDNNLDIIYTDGAGNFSKTPYSELTAAETFQNAINQLTTGDTTTTTGTTTKKWYQKVWVWFAVGTVATITGILIYKNKKK